MAVKSTSAFLASHKSVDGVLYPPFVSPAHLEDLKSFQRRPDDVFLICYPKSGTHWLIKIVTLIVHNGADQYVQCAPTREEVVWIEESEKATGLAGHTIADLDKKIGPRLFASHSYYRNTAGGPPNTSPAKYIYCARNPKDVTVAFYHHLLQRRDTDDKIAFDLSWDEFVDYFLRGQASFGSWWEHVPEWWTHRDDDNVLFLQYEDMKTNLSDNITSIAKFLGYNLDQATIDKIAEATTVDNMRNNTSLWTEQKFIRKGIVGDWKNHFTPAQSQAFDDAYSRVANGIGLEIKFE